MVAHSVGVAASNSEGIVLVVPEGELGKRVAEASCRVVAGTELRVVLGGASRSDSVRQALAAVPDDAEIVVVHDAARPLATPALFRQVQQAVADGASAAICAVPVTDTIKRVKDGWVVETLQRDTLVSVQTPQAFQAAALRAAHASCSDATDDSTLVEAIGGRVVVVPGHSGNLKITEPTDLHLAEAVLTEVVR